MDEEFTTTAYPNVQENLKLLTEDQFFVEKTQEEEPGNTNAEAEVQSMVSVPIHQDTSSVPPMTNPVEGHTTPLQARFRDLPTVDMKEILQQQMFEDNSYQAHDVYNDLYEALKKSLELDYSNQRLADQEEARKKRLKRRDVPRTPPGSPPLQPPPPPPPAGASGALGTLGALGSSQLPPPPSTDTRYELVGIFRTHELSPTDYLMQDDSIPEEQVLLSDDEDSENDHQLKADLDVAKNWASVLATTYEPLAENSLLAKIGDMTTFLKWYCRQVNKTTLIQADFEGQAYEVVKAFYPDVIHLRSRWRSVTKCSQLRLTGRIQKEIISRMLFHTTLASRWTSLGHCHYSTQFFSCKRLGVFEIWQQGKQSCSIDFQDEGC
ncbi:hypothetical protein Tco_0569702 [Tanacetum coccineum]